jgi:hypothetical protein
VEHSCKQIILPNRNRILSLYLRNSIFVTEFFTHCLIDSSFDRLESIGLFEVSVYNLTGILFQLKSLSRLSKLIIHLDTADDSYIDLSEIYRMVLRLPSLKYSSLLLLADNNINALVLIAINERYSTLEYLSMGHNYTLNELICILCHTPRLRRLVCDNLLKSYADVKKKFH